MFHSVSLLSQAPLARGSCALPSVLYIYLDCVLVWLQDKNERLDDDELAEKLKEKQRAAAARKEQVSNYVAASFIG